MDSFIIANPDAEQGVLGCILIDEGALAVANHYITASDFNSEKEAWIFQAMLDMQQKGMMVSIETVCDELATRKQLTEIGGMAYVMDLINATPSSIYAESFAKIVARDSLRRSLVRAAGQMAQLAYDKTDVGELISGAIAVTSQATRHKSSSEPAPFNDILQDVTRDALAAHSGRKPSGLIDIGMASISPVLGPLRPKNTYIIAARPGVGKSSLALAVAINAAKRQGRRVAVFSMEMDKQEWVRRALSVEVGVSATDIYLGNLGDIEEFHRAVGRASNPNLFIDDTPGLTPQLLYSKADRLQQMYGLDLVIVDYIQLMHEGKMSRDRRVEMDMISRESKLMSSQLYIPVINVAQLSRAVEQRQDKEPVLSDLRETGALEQDATAVLFLWRDSGLQPEGQRYEVNWKVDKNRMGALGKGKINFIPYLTQFVDTAPAPTEQESQQYRRDMAFRCKALDMSWADWDTKDEQRSRVLKSVRDVAIPALMSNKWVIFHGRSGVGKSHMARIVQAELIRSHGMPATYVNWRILTEEVRRSWNDENGNENLIREPLTAPVVIVDELDINRLENGKATWQAEQLYDLFDSSMALENANVRRPLLLIMHVPPKEFANQLATKYGDTGISAANRLMMRSGACTIDFSNVPPWKEKPNF